MACHYNIESGRECNKRFAQPHPTRKCQSFEETPFSGRQQVVQVGLAGRIDFQAGDFLQDELPGEQDVVLLFNILDRCAPHDGPIRTTQCGAGSHSLHEPCASIWLVFFNTARESQHMSTFDERDLYSGLAALHWWAYDEPSWDHDFYKAIIEQADGLALDVGCGAGRLLRSYLRAGLAVEGVDIAADMLAVCRDKAHAEGLQPVLYEQPMQALDLPKRYAAIIIPCGSFVCVMGRDNALEALRRLYFHLLPGGILAFNAYLPDYDYSRPYDPSRYPTEWKPHVEKTYPEQPGRRLVVERRQTGVDPVEQIECEERRYRLYQDDQLVAEEVHAGQNHWYFKHEVLLMLRLAGFDDVAVKGDYTQEDFGPQHTGTVVFLAHKGV